MIIVTGLGRCGTTLVMHMLDKAGVPLLGDAQYPDYEYSAEFDILDAALVEKNLQNKSDFAFKILHPPLFDRLRLNNNTKIILLKRDFKQQTLSQIKFAKLHDVEIKQKAKYEKLLKRDFFILQSKIKRFESLTINFEDLITEPGYQAHRITGFINKKGNENIMGNCVIKRTVKNYPGFLELQLLKINYKQIK